MTRPWIKPTLVAAVTVAVLIVVLVVVHAVQAAHAREQACEFQQVYAGNDAGTASVLCHNGA